MKKKALYFTILSAVVILVSSAIPVLAAYVGSIYNEASIKEPLSTRTISFDAQEVFPGQEVAWAAEIKNNTANITYGLQYYAGAYYSYSSYGAMGMQAMDMENFDRLTSTNETAPAMVEQVEKLTLETTAYAGGGGIYTNVGELTLFVDPDGLAGPLPEQRYVPGQTINIAPGTTHLLKLKLNVSLAAYPGTVRSYIDPYRGAPATQ